MRFLPLIVLALAAGCRSDRISGSSGDLSIDPMILVFPRTILTHPTQATLELRNGGRSARSVTLQTDAPFSFVNGSFEVPGGSSVWVVLTFDPQAAGQISGVLNAQSGDQKMEASLIGPAELPPACAERGLCWY